MTYGDRRMLWKLGYTSLLLNACGGSPDAATAMEMDEQTAEACGQDGVICTYMGNGIAGLGHDGQAPLEVSLYLPQDLVIAEDGTPYVLDWNNHRVRTLEDGVVETVIGTGELGDGTDGPAREVSLNHPTHITFDPEGRLILSAWHNSKVMRYDEVTDRLTTICGDGRRDYGGDDGPAEKAVLDLPVATAFDQQGRMLIMDQANQRIRRVEDDGMIRTVVGPSQEFAPAPEGLTPVCGLEAPAGLATCKLCLEEDAGDSKCPPQKPQGFGGDDGPGTDALIYQPFSQSAPPAGRMEMGPDGVLYFCDTGNHRIRSLSEDGIVRTVAGSGPDEFDRDYEGGYGGDGGPALEALLARPTDIAVDVDGSLYIADTFNSCVRKVDPEGTISTAAGRCGEQGFDGDEGPADEAKLNRPYGIALDLDGNLYIADTHNHRIRIVHLAR
jgi:DNA-binding beta-propeller fold protein YncE